MVQSCQSRFTLLAADRSSAAATLLTSPLQTRVGVSRRRASGRKSRQGYHRSMFTLGSRACAYKTASGRRQWPNRDPLGEFGFEMLRTHNSHGRVFLTSGIVEVVQGPNIYEFDKNSSISSIDKWGLDDAACAACKQQYLKDLEQAGQIAEACLAAKEGWCARFRGNPTAMSFCVTAALLDCAAITAVAEDIAAAQLAGCLSGCQPSTCPPKQPSNPRPPYSPYPPYPWPGQPWPTGDP